MQIINGYLSDVRQIASSHFSHRPPGAVISLIVIHGISLPPQHFGGHYVDDLFTGNLDPRVHPYFKALEGLEVSSHLFIDRAGIITQYVSFEHKAWHAGRSSYQGQKECNDYSIGIELEGSDYCAYTLEQYQILKEVIAVLKASYPAIGDNLAGHNEVAPQRKTDPGPHFNWQLFRK